MPGTPSPVDIYARVSRRGDKQQRSMTSQVAVCREVLAGRGLPVGVVHDQDDGRSAWNPKVRRGGWDALMGRLEGGQAGGVIVFDLERFTRQPMEGERLIQAAEHGLIVLDSDQQFDLTTSSGKKAFRDAMAAAAYYSDRLSDRVKRGKAAKARAGESNGNRRPFGFEDDLVTIREDEAAELRALVARFLAGVPQDWLIADLNGRGVLTAYGGRWSSMGLRSLLTRERNCGHIVHRGAVVGRLPGEPIISEADHGRVVAMFEARRRGRPPSPAYLCSGMVVCGLCGAGLSGRPRSNMRPYPDGEVRREYWCSYSHGGCGKMFVDQRALDELAGVLAVRILSDPRHAAMIEQAAARNAERAATLDVQIAREEDLALALADRLGRGEIPLDRYDAAVKPLDRRIAELKAERSAVGGDGPALPEAGDWLARWGAADHGERRALLRKVLRGRFLQVKRGARDDAAGRVTLTKGT